MLYEVTVTLKPAMYRKTCREQFLQTASLMIDAFKGFKSSGMAELTKEHNIHYHCMVELKDHMERDQLLNRFRKSAMIRCFGRKSCSQVVNEPKYRDYMVKDYRETFELLGCINPLIFDDLDIGNLLGYYEGENVC
jgi:hypothetical protein